MKKSLLGLVCLVGILVGCTAPTNVNQTNELEELKKQIEDLSLERDTLLTTMEAQEEALELAIHQQEDNEYKTILAKDIVKYPQTLYKTKTMDLDGDGEEELIELYVNAGKMENGVFAWDDGQNWLLVVKDGEITYPLYDEYIQLGSLDFTTTTFDGKPGIVMLMMQHGDITIEKFIFDDGENGYQKEPIYKKINTQDQYNQPASYAFLKDAHELMETAFTTKTVAVLDASEKTLQDSVDRVALIEQILTDVENAQQKLEIVVELNPEIRISLKSAIDLLNQLINNPPTAEQMDELKSIHSVFKEIGNGELINEDENQINSNVKEKFRRIGFIAND